MNRAFLSHLLFTFCFLLSQLSHASNIRLPELGDSSSSIVSLQKERQLGQYWLQAFRQQAQINHDPLLYTYLFNLIQKLAFYSPMQEKYFNLVLVDTKDFNAFAVPGHIVGINLGLLLYADSEDQLASVIGHELAHLSQRHYARTLEMRKQQGIMSIIGLLGSLLILAAGGGGEATMAAISATQAAAIDNQLKYSRSHEQEADRIGIQTLAKADYNPKSMAEMFQHLLVLTRYNKQINELSFLLTHPLTDARVADTLNLAKQYPDINDQDSFDFHLMKTRATLRFSANASAAISYFEQQKPQSPYPDAIDYGISLALIDQKKLDQAQKLLLPLYKKHPDKTAFKLAYSTLLNAQGKPQEARLLLEQQLKLTPNDYALSMALAKLYTQNKQYTEAAKILRQLTQSGWPNTPDIWFELAETEGQAGNIYRLHLARGEYFFQLGAFERAISQLLLAKKSVSDDLLASSRIDMRINEIQQWIKDNPFK